MISGIYHPACSLHHLSTRSAMKSQLRPIFLAILLGIPSALLGQTAAPERIYNPRISQANPDLVARMRSNAALNAPDMATFYIPGAKGYTDYPALAA